MRIINIDETKLSHGIILFLLISFVLNLQYYFFSTESQYDVLYLPVLFTIFIGLPLPSIITSFRSRPEDTLSAIFIGFLTAYIGLFVILLITTLTGYTIFNYRVYAILFLSPTTHWWIALGGIIGGLIGYLFSKYDFSKTMRLLMRSKGH